MADENGKARENETVLVAYVTVHLESGASFELLPFEDAEDVKSKVGDLIGDWAKTGYLIRGGDIIPWHRVQRIEATKVEELSRREWELRRGQWEAADTARMQQNFWRTKKAREKKEKGDKNGEKGGEENASGKAA